MFLPPRYFTETAFDPIAVVAGVIQTGIYADFGYIVCHPLRVRGAPLINAGSEST